MKLYAALTLTTLLACSASAFAQTIGIPRHQRRRSSGTARQLSRGTPSQKNLGAITSSREMSAKNRVLVASVMTPRRSGWPESGRRATRRDN
jgi:hypothetical protein